MLIENSQRVAHTSHTVIKADRILEPLQQIREQGYAMNGQELFLGDMTIGAPVMGANGRQNAEKQLTPALLQCSRALSNSARNLE